MAVGPAIGLFLTSRGGFRGLFFTAVATTFIAMVLAFSMKLRKTSPSAGRDRDQSQSQESGQPAARPSYFEKSAFRPSLVMFFVTATYGALVSFLALYAGTLGISNVGMFFTVYAVALMISRPLFGRMADRRNNDVIIIVGILALFAALIILSQARSVGQLWLMLLPAAFIYGLGSALWGLIAQQTGYSVMYMCVSISALCALICYLILGRLKKRNVQVI